MSNLRRLRANLSIRTVCALALAIAVTGCGGVGDAPEQDQAVVLQDRLEADGTDPEVVACMLHVGRNELERGQLSTAAADELLVNCRAAERVITNADQPTEPDFESTLTELAMTPMVWTRGDDRTLDRLWEGCEAGSGAACDKLFDASPVGSDYEDFGVSCGDRPDVLDCAELDQPIEEAGQP